MKLYELTTDQDLQTGYYNSSEDKLNARKPNDTRKPVLSLKHLSRLKKMRAVKKLEDFKHEDLLQTMYGIPDEPAGPPGF